MAEGRPGRTRSIQRMIVSLLVVPLVALVGLWVFAATVTVGDSLRLVRARTFDAKVVRPTEALITALQHERRMSVAFLGDDPTVGRVGFDAQRRLTDRARDGFGAASRSGDLEGAATDETRSRMRALAVRLDGLGQLRRQVDGVVATRDRVLDEYTRLIAAAGAIYDAAYPGDARTGRDTRTLIGLQGARERISYQDAVITGALSHRVPTKAERAAFTMAVGSHRARYEELIQALPAADRARLVELREGPEQRSVTTLENMFIQGGDQKASPVRLGQWHAASEALLNRLVAFEDQTRAGISTRAAAHARTVLTRLALAGGLGLVALVGSIAVGVRMGRRLVRDNRRMVRTVESFATERLPAIAELVQRGETVDPDAGAPRGGFTVREVSQVYEAFAQARRAVVTATVSEAAARRGLGEVFVNLARRNQVLLQRLLRLLDGMERKARDPDELTDLFAVDHLVTRMRRHAEGLVILAGRSAGRTWRRPVPVVDIVRAAVSEVEEYQRVKVLPMPESVAVSGTAAADVIHLLAELIENATMYSPPELRVQISGTIVAHGLALEVEDRGLGLDAEKMAVLNRTLAEAPDFDLFDSARLGLFVVARLAQRHDVQVTLRTSPYGGTTAVALLPVPMLVTAEEAPAEQPPAEPPSRPRMRAEPPATVAPTAEGELPRRRRNTSPEPRESSPGLPVAAERPPEQARSVVSAMQRGWQRGREEAEQHTTRHETGLTDGQ